MFFIFSYGHRNYIIFPRDFIIMMEICITVTFMQMTDNVPVIYIVSLLAILVYHLCQCPLHFQISNMDILMYITEHKHSFTNVHK